VESTGVTRSTLQALLLKALYRGGVDSLPGLSEMLKLPSHIVGTLIEEAVEHKLLKVTGATARSTLPVLTYSLTPSGRLAAVEALEKNQYIGPAPVSLSAYTERAKSQKLSHALVEAMRIKEALSDLVLSEEILDQVGPAIKAGRSILFYGPPGNGKSSIARRIGRVFSDVIHVPYCIEVEGQIIKIYDPKIHQEVARSTQGNLVPVKLRHENFDRRWVACRRPVVITGGEFSLDMLELRYIEESNFYEAPLHIKAIGGTFVIDDFGRQIVQPKDLLNRWMIPLEEHVDYLKLHTGATFAVPFDALVLFCTNLAPSDLMDAAFLRRIPYKIRLTPPSIEQFGAILRREAAERGLGVTPSLFDWLIAELESRRHFTLACYQPRFIVDHVIETSAFRKLPPEISEALVSRALDNLYPQTV
jgi:predicted ATPase with chaperone activity